MQGEINTVVVSISSPKSINFNFEEELSLEEIVSDPENWKTMTEDEKHEAIAEVVTELIFTNYIDWGYEEYES